MPGWIEMNTGLRPSPYSLPYGRTSTVHPNLISVDNDDDDVDLLCVYIYMHTHTYVYTFPERKSRLD